MSLYTYDPELYTAFFGPIILGDFSEGVAIAVNDKNDLFALKKGIGNTGTRIKITDRSAEITIRLELGSSTNAKLSAMAAADWLAPNGDGIWPFSITDNHNGGAPVVFAAFTWIRKRPSNQISSDAETKEWMLETDNLTINAFLGLPEMEAK